MREIKPRGRAVSLKEKSWGKLGGDLRKKQSLGGEITSVWSWSKQKKRTSSLKREERRQRLKVRGVVSQGELGPGPRPKGAVGKGTQKRVGGGEKKEKRALGVNAKNLSGPQKSLRCRSSLTKRKRQKNLDRLRENLRKRRMLKMEVASGANIQWLRKKKEMEGVGRRRRTQPAKCGTENGNEGE